MGTINSALKSKKVLADEREKLGLLVEFVDDKAKKYIEPQRKGTPRGEKVGFPLHKYFISLFVALFKGSLKDIAQGIDTSVGVSAKRSVSYGLLRKWKTEPDFQAKLDKHREEFVAYIIKYLKTQLKNYCKAVDDYLNGVIDKPPAGYVIDKAICPAPFFNESVVFRLGRIAQNIIENMPEAYETDKLVNNEFILNLYLVDVIDNLILHAAGHEIRPEIADIVSQIDFARMLLSLNVLPETARCRLALISLSHLQQYLRAIVEKESKGSAKQTGKLKHGKKASAKKATAWEPRIHF